MDEQDEPAGDDRTERARLIEGLRGVASYVGVDVPYGHVLVGIGSRSGERLFVRRGRAAFRLLGRAVASLDALTGPEAVAGTTLVDIGAGAGAMTLAALRGFGFADAVSIEENEELSRLLRANIALNDLEGRVRCVRAGLTEETARESPLDTLAAEVVRDNGRIGLIRVDPGADAAAVLRGAGTLLDAGVPLMVTLAPEAAVSLRDTLLAGYTHFIDLRHRAAEGARFAPRPMSALAAGGGHDAGDDALDLLLVRLDPSQVAAGVPSVATPAPAPPTPAPPSAVSAEAPDADPWDAVRARRLAAPSPVTEPILLISQIQRSGGTMTSRLFDGHPDCLAHPWELSWAGKAKTLWPAPTLNRKPRALFANLEEPWLARVLKRGEYRKDVRGLAAAEESRFVFDRDLQERIFVALAEANPPASPRELFNQYLTAFFNAWLDCEAIERPSRQFVTAFTPRLVMYPDHLAQFFFDYPDGYLVTVVRDPVSWLASAMPHKPEWYGNVDLSARLWIASAKASMAAEDDHPGRVVGVLFEDLLANTEAVMRRICAVTGLAFHESLLTPTMNGQAILPNSSFALPSSSVSRDAADRSQHLSPDDAARMREKTAGVHAAARARFGL